MTFKCLDIEDNVSYLYIPFTQGCLVEGMHEEFEGACVNLSDEWLIKRTEIFNDSDSPVYGRGKANNPYVPHPVVRGNNYQLSLTYSVFNKDPKQLLILIGAKISDDEKIDKIIQAMMNKKYVSGRISSIIVDTEDNQYSHCCAFVKQENRISFFDPSHGEVYFYNIEKFKIWFKQEINIGVLQFLLPSNTCSKTVTDLFLGGEQETMKLVQEAKNVLGIDKFGFFYPNLESKIEEKIERLSNIPVHRLNTSLEYWSSNKELDLNLPKSMQTLGILRGIKF